MNDDRKTGFLITVFVCIAAGIAIFVFSVGVVRTWLADRKALSFAKETGIDTSYVISSPPMTIEEAMRELYTLAVWAERVSPEIDKAFGHSKVREYNWIIKDPGGYAPKEELEKSAMRRRWKNMHKDLTRSITESAQKILEPFQEEVLFSAYSFSECFYHRWFDLIIKTVDRLDQGQAEEAYAGARFRSRKYEWKMVPMDIGFTLYPDLVVTGCEEHLDESVRHDGYEQLDREVMCAYQFSERYGVSADNLKRAQDKRNRMLDARIRSSSPKSGSSTSGTRRNSSSTRRRSSASGSSSFDPDDHDIEAYYQDNIDEYDDYDDAYDGFLDDDSAWDDY